MPAVAAVVFGALGAGLTGVGAAILIDCPKLAQPEAWPLWLLAGVSAGMAKYAHSGRPKA